MTCEEEMVMTTRSEQQEILEVFNQRCAAWDKGDASAYASYYSEDADYITYQGEHLKGRKQIAEVHQRMLNSLLKGSRMQEHTREVRFLAPDIAVVIVVGAIKLRWQRKAPKRRLSINTNLLLKQDGHWKIAVFQNDRIRGKALLERILAPFVK
jgi:uncharacterized protein (TIGR02246 family)